MFGTQLTPKQTRHTTIGPFAVPPGMRRTCKQTTGGCTHKGSREM